jgi:methanethiol S-methyltransferase
MNQIHQNTFEMAYIILFIMWAAFYMLHSLFASLNIKIIFQGWLGSGYKWYRLIYSLFSSILFLGIMLYAGQIQIMPLIAKSDLLTYIGYLISGLGTIILVKAFKNFKLSKFFGIVPEFPADDLILIRKGIHSTIRHPIYTGTLLIFIGYFFYQPYLTSLVHLMALVIYLPFGIHFEEKKLVSSFGEKYLKYKKEVPALVPWKMKKDA